MRSKEQVLCELVSLEIHFSRFFIFERQVRHLCLFNLKINSLGILESIFYVGV